MHKLSKIVALVLVVAGALLGLMAWQMGDPVASSQAASTAAPLSGSEEVVVAQRPIPAGQAIQPEDVVLQRLPQRPAGTLVQTSQAVGQVLGLDLPAGAPVLEAFVWQGLAMLLRDGERAVAIKVEEASAVGHQLRPGDWVDVFFQLRKDGSEVGQTQSRLLLARKRVLAYGPLLVEQAARGEKPAAGAASGPQAAARTAVLAVGVDEVNPLSLADRQGQLVLALRNPQDQALPDAPLSAMAVQHKAGARALAPLDQAQAGLGIAALAAAPGSATARVAAPAAPRAAHGSEAGGRNTVAVEFIRGTQTGTVRY